MAAVEVRRENVTIPRDAGLPPALARLLEAMLRTRPDERPADLQKLFAEAAPGLERAAPARTPRRSGLALAAGAGVLAAAGAGLWFALPYLDTPPGSRVVTDARAVVAAHDPLAEIESRFAAGDVETAFASLMALANDQAGPPETRRQAYFALGRMYDPASFNASRSPFKAPNASAARRNYQAAADLGSAEARQSPCPAERMTMLRLLVLVLSLAATALWAGDVRPLVMEGKSALPQRVLVREAGERLETPGGRSLGPVVPLQQFYVYARQDGWVKVGPGQDGSDLGWLPAQEVADWNQNIVATLEVTAGLERTLFFSDFDAAYEVVEAEDPGRDAAALRAEAEAAEQSGAPSDRIVALGPREAIDQRQRLHVLPILSAEEALFESGAFVNLLKVAVARAQAPSEAAQPIGQPMRAGIVFVVDTTHSMAPYISATRDALREVYGEVAAAGLSDRVSFGLVGYRDSLKGQPALDYAARTFVTLEEGRTAEGFPRRDRADVRGDSLEPELPGGQLYRDRPCGDLARLVGIRRALPRAGDRRRTPRGHGRPERHRPQRTGAEPAGA